MIKYDHDIMARSFGKFARLLNFSELLAIAIGGTISSTYFLGNGFLLHQLGPFAFLAYLAGGVVTYLTMNAMAELAGNETPSHLSFIKYSHELFSPAVACGVGYSYWVNWIFYIPTECISAGYLLNALMPHIPIALFATLIAFLIFVLNQVRVKYFADASEWFTFSHLLIFAVFSIFAVLIFLGFIGDTQNFLGLKFIWPQSGAFPNGYKIFLLNGIVMLLNFQGAEILGLAASETRHPKVDVPKTIKEMAPTVTLLYVIPMMLLAMIYPWDNPVIEGSVFSRALAAYGFKDLGFLFVILIVCGAISVSNSGLFASNRCAHAMSHYNLIPQFFSKLSNVHIPSRLNFLSFGLVASMLLITFLFPSARFYEILLSLSGFSGSISWIAICAAQIKKRTQMKKSDIAALNFKDRLFPYGAMFAILFMLFCMFIILIDPEIRLSAIVGTLSFMIPYLGFKIVTYIKARH